DAFCRVTGGTEQCSAPACPAGSGDIVHAASSGATGSAAPLQRAGRYSRGRAQCQPSPGGNGIGRRFLYQHSGVALDSGRANAFGPGITAGKGRNAGSAATSGFTL